MGKDQDPEAPPTTISPMTTGQKTCRARLLLFVVLVTASVALGLGVYNNRVLAGLALAKQPADASLDKRGNELQVDQANANRHPDRQARQATAWSAGRCQNWRSACLVQRHHHATPHHAGHFIGARVTLSENVGHNGRRSSTTPLQWAYNDDCLARCAGLSSDDGRYLEVMRGGVYNVRARFLSLDFFANRLGIFLWVKRNGSLTEKRVSDRWFPNTPVVVDGQQMVHSELERGQKIERSRDGANVRPTNLSKHLQKTLWVPISLHRIIALEPGDKLRVEAVHDCSKKYACPLRVDSMGNDSSAFEIFRV